MSYESLPAWNCDHNWRPVGKAIKTWVSNSTRQTPPKNAPKMQKVRCTKCKGIDYTYI